MSFLDGSKSKQIEYLEDERRKLWERVSGLEGYVGELKKEIERKTSDDEKEAKQHSKKASEFRNKIEAKLEEAQILLEQLNSELESARTTKNQINDYSVDANEQKLAVDEVKSRLDDAESEFDKKLESLNSRIRNIDGVFEKYPELDSKLSEIEDFISTVEENLDKSSVSLTAINKRKKEVDDLYREVFGYVQTDESTGEETKIDGLKGELDATYDDLKLKIEESFESVENLNKNYKDSYKVFEEEFKKKYQKINDDIASLLPDAMTAGLSSAFSKKKDDEVESSKVLQKRFSQGIYFMIGVSFIPVVISIFFLVEGITVQEVITRLPRLVLAIVPMYIPVLWFTYSANKKLNLSKRLIEEYSHKEVLSRTYEGLSTQIESLNNPEESEELRFRLLSNFLQISAENPGKLISNYEASDHPVMEALEQSYKFQMTIDKLSGIPGLGRVAAMLEKNAKKKVSAKKEVIDKALESAINNGQEVGEDEE
ncbi:hypothetical protein [Flagellimonas pelagia]|uniref:Uncharacterized protein n=1 Tax=Flagellimonas pelagia TaxID=2306998 RepID=A0A3A1NBY9_9FLAO|nr:hypothetical protein [Allomuricauda maritima]RIV41836.1 hypothetical protein D2V05_17075 [Allomuricauda maritima]TXJ90712.1 hypothetical protein FQ017_16925 [Allomuricauda maritima]